MLQRDANVRASLCDQYHEQRSRAEDDYWRVMTGELIVPLASEP